MLERAWMQRKDVSDNLGGVLAEMKTKCSANSKEGRVLVGCLLGRLSFGKFGLQDMQKVMTDKQIHDHHKVR